MLLQRAAYCLQCSQYLKERILEWDFKLIMWVYMSGDNLVLALVVLQHTEQIGTQIGDVGLELVAERNGHLFQQIDDRDTNLGIFRP